MAYAFVGVGLLLLIVGGEVVLRGGVGLSRALGLSPLLIGLVVIAAGTSAPELAVSVTGAAHDAPDIAIGNVVGSNIVNILLILGIGALIRPIPAPPKVVWRDGFFLLLASVALAVVALCGAITRPVAYAFLGAFAVFLLVSFFTDWRRSSHNCGNETRAMARLDGRAPHAGRSLFLLVVGLIALYFGGRTVLDGSVSIARIHHVPEAVIALTVIAVGTSLPELVTTLIGSARGQSNLVMGNLIGSNIFNILFVLGVAALVHPLAVSPMLAHADLPAMVAAAVALLAMLTVGWRLSRGQGLLLLMGFAAYVVFLAWRQGYIPAHPFGLF